MAFYFNALRAQADRLATTSPVQSSSGANRNSIFTAIFANIDTQEQDALEVSEIPFAGGSPVTDIGVFVFLQDAPIYLHFTQQVPAGFVNTLADGVPPTFETSSSLFPETAVTDPLQATNLTLGMISPLQTEPIAGRNEAQRGRTTTGDVSVVGYAARANWTNPVGFVASSPSPPAAAAQLWDSADSTARTEITGGFAFLSVHSRSDIDYGEVAYDVVDEDLNATQFVPILLREDQYTQEMADAGNVYVDPVSGITARIVGLWTDAPTATQVGGGGNPALVAP